MNLNRARTYSFEDKSQFEAIQNVSRKRSEKRPHYLKTKTIGPWDWPAPDLSLQAWEPSLPQRISHIIVKPGSSIKTVSANTDRIKNLRNASGTFIKSKSKWFPSPEEKKNTFITHVRDMRPFTAKRLFVSSGSFKAGVYVMPKPYDHRGLIPIDQLGLPEFKTKYDHDPMELKFRNQNRPQIWGLPSLNSQSRNSNSSFITPPRKPYLWEKNLYLPKEAFPNRENEFTRYRLKFRDPHEVFLHDVNQRLQLIWKRRKQKNNS